VKADVRFIPKSCRGCQSPARPLRAINGLMHRSNRASRYCRVMANFASSWRGLSSAWLLGGVVGKARQVDLLDPSHFVVIEMSHIVLVTFCIMRALPDGRNRATIDNFRLVRGSPRVLAQCGCRFQRSYHAT
jgi:hypothetical protein